MKNSIAAIQTQYSILEQTYGGNRSDFEAMLDWLEANGIQPSLNLVFKDDINSLLVKRWFEFRDSLHNVQHIPRDILESIAREKVDAEDFYDLQDNMDTISDGHLMALGRIFYGIDQHPSSEVQNISITWSTECVQKICPSLSDDQAYEVLKHIKGNHLIDIGEIVCDSIDELFPEFSKDLAAKLLGSSSESKQIHDEYAEAIIQDSSYLYDAVEIHGVRNLNDENDPNGTHFVVDDENPQLYSVYLHVKTGGVECIGDFSNHEDASVYAKRIADQYAWTVHDFSNYTPSNETISESNVTVHNEYADPTILSSPHPYDRIEIHGVRNLNSVDPSVVSTIR